MKKTILVVLLVLLCATPLFAAQKSGIALGLNVGYPGVGLAFKYDMDKFDLTGTVNYLYAGGIGGDVAASYAVTDFDIERAKFYVTAGGGAYVGFNFNSGRIVVAPEAFVGVSYYFSGDLPLSIYLRGNIGCALGFGGNAEFSAGLTGGGSLGVLYHF